MPGVGWKGGRLVSASTSMAPPAHLRGRRGDDQPPRWCAPLTSLLVLVGALAVFFTDLATPYAWTDEGVTYVTIHRRWPDLLQLWHGSDAPLLPYYAVVKAWVQVSGVVAGPDVTLWRIRSLSAVAAAVAAVVIKMLVARHRGQIVGIWAAGAFVALPGVSRYAQEARPYALLMLATAASWWAFDRWWAGRPAEAPLRADGLGVDPGRAHTRWFDAALVSVCLIAAVLMSLFGALQWVGLAVVAAWLTAPARHRQLGFWPRARSWGWSWLCGVAPLVVAGAVVAWPAVHIAVHGGGAVQPGGTSFHDLAGLMATLIAVRWRPWWVIWVTSALVACSGLGLVDARRRLAIVAAWIWLLVPLALSIALGVVHPAFLRVRYWMPLAVPLAILAGLGAAEVGRVAARWRPWCGHLIAGGLIVLLAVASLPQQGAVRRGTGHDADLAPVLATVRKAQRAHHGARIVVTSNGASFYFAQPAPDLFGHNLLMSPDFTSINVWCRVASPSQRRARMDAAPSVIWIRWTPSASPPSAVTVSAELADAGLRPLSYTKIGPHWSVSVYVR